LPKLDSWCKLDLGLASELCQIKVSIFAKLVCQTAGGYCFAKIRFLM
jgi:arylamine N-acetyltransferase